MAFLDYTDILTFVPTISGQSSAGVGTYTLQSGFYHIVGNIVFVFGSLAWTAHTGTGNLLVTNLPFTCRNQPNYDPECNIRTDSISWPPSTTYVFGEIQPNTKICQLWGVKNGVASEQVLISNAGSLHFTGFYLK